MKFYILETLNKSIGRHKESIGSEQEWVKTKIWEFDIFSTLFSVIKEEEYICCLTSSINAELYFKKKFERIVI